MHTKGFAGFPVVEQSGNPAVHEVEHPPQWLELLKAVSQPSSGFVEQNPVAPGAGAVVERADAGHAGHVPRHVGQARAVVPARAAVVQVGRDVGLAAIERCAVAVGVAGLADGDVAGERPAVGASVGRPASGHGVQQLARTAVRGTAPVSRIVEGDAGAGAGLGASIAPGVGHDARFGRLAGLGRRCFPFEDAGLRDRGFGLRGGIVAGRGVLRPGLRRELKVPVADERVARPAERDDAGTEHGGQRESRREPRGHLTTLRR